MLTSWPTLPGPQMLDLLSLLGFDLQALVAGLSGGIAVVFAFRKSNPWDMVGSVVVGGLFGNFVGGVVCGVLGTSHGAASFFVGVVSTPLCKAWVASIKRQSK